MNNLQDWPGITSDGGFPSTKEESVSRWLIKVLSVLTSLAVLGYGGYSGLSYIIGNELHDIDSKVTSNSISIQYMREDLKSLKQDVGVLKRDIAGAKVSLARIEGYLIQLNPPSSRIQD